MKRKLDRIVKSCFGHIPSRRLLLFAFAILIVSSVVFTSYLLISGGNRIVHQVISDAARTASRQARGEIRRFIKTPVIIGENIRYAALAGYISSDDQNSLSRFLWALPQRDREYAVSAVFYSNAAGVFTGLGTDLEHDPAQWKVSQASPTTAGYFTEFLPETDGAPGKQISRGDQFDPRARPWFQQAAQSTEAIWTDLYTDAMTGESVLTWASAIRNADGELVGVAGVDLFLKKIRQFLSQLPLSERAEVFLTDSSGKLLGGNGDEQAWNSDAQPEDTAASGPYTQSALDFLRVQADGIENLQAPFNQHISLRGDRGFLHAARVDDSAGLEWSVGVFIPSSDYLSSMESQFARVLPWAIACLMLCAATLWFFLSLVARPLHQLRSGANRIADGDFNVHIDTSCTNEVGELASAIDLMRHRLRNMFNHIKQQRDLAETTLRTIADGVITINEKGLVTYMNLSAEKQTGWQSADLTGHSVEHLFSATDVHTQSLFKSGVLMRSLAVNPFLDQHLLLIDKTGNTHNVECHIRPTRSNNVAEKGAVLVFSDVSEQRRLRSELSHQATHDELTGLANRREFDKQLQTALAQTRLSDTKHVLCYMDLDQFKVVNDTCGHVAGDEMLRQIAQLLQSQIRAGDLLARLGGDEFGLLLNHCSIEQAERVTSQLLKVVSTFRFTWEQRTFRMGASIGVARVDAASANATETLRNADSACYAAKDLGRNRVHVYRTDDQDLAQRREEMQWVDKIDYALEHDEFQLYTQTIEHTKEVQSHPLHFEVLIRMRDANGSIVSPGVFLPPAERFNLASKIDRWVVSNTLSWLSDNPAVTAVLGLCSINLSGHSLGDSTFLTFILEEIENSSVPAENICFEITETATIANLSSAIVLINTLREKGCSFALDDFGSGLSSFAYLKTLPVDYLKIDGVFVRDMISEVLDFAMVRSINEIGQIMGMQTIAEFVENDEIRLKLETLGVDFVQGYGIAKPEPIAALLH